MDSRLDETELTLAERFLHLVEVMEAGVADYLLDGANPSLFLVSSL
jgi:hypothetical protein